MVRGPFCVGGGDAGGAGIAIDFKISPMGTGVLALFASLEWFDGKAEDRDGCIENGKAVVNVSR